MTFFTGEKRGNYAFAHIFFCVAVVFSSGGCATSGSSVRPTVPDAEMQAALAEKPAALQAAYQRIMFEGDRNLVLNQMIAGVDAWKMGYWDQAHDLFENVCKGIERVYSDSPEAAKARSLWYEEGRKIFKGEPYERVMAFYYRGLSYLNSQDIQNARASFWAGMLQDAFAEEEQHRCDFALMLYLSGWCSLQLDDKLLVKSDFDELKDKLRPDVVLPESGDNVLFIMETGTAPRKLSDGVGHYQLKFFRGKDFSEKKVFYNVEGVVSGAGYPIEDIFWQAATRGGRLVDSINQGKAQFKKETQIVGSALSNVASNAMLASTIFSGAASELQGVGAAVGFASVVTHVASRSARAEADTRAWSNLPDTVHVASLNLSPGAHCATFQFADGDGMVIPMLNKQVVFQVPESGFTLVWIRSRD